MTDWSSRIASITGAAGFVVGGAAYLTSRRATKASERSATASEGSAEAAKASAASSDRAAGAAERSAAETEAVGGITRSQRHDELSPQRNGLAVTFELVPNRTTGGRNLFATITADRSYRAVAIGRYRTAGTHDVGQFVPLVAGSPERVNVEMLAADRAEPETRDLLLPSGPLLISTGLSSGSAGAASRSMKGRPRIRSRTGNWRRRSSCRRSCVVR